MLAVTRLDVDLFCVDGFYCMFRNGRQCSGLDLIS